jgi:hypothetical protein
MQEQKVDTMADASEARLENRDAFGSPDVVVELVVVGVRGLVVVLERVVVVVVCVVVVCFEGELVVVVETCLFTTELGPPTVTVIVEGAPIVTVIVEAGYLLEQKDRAGG